MAEPFRIPGEHDLTVVTTENNACGLATLD